jgi:lipid II:glycine glycyltransferase (peptidoglycan interpeptide bridge formation enzyme)
MNLAIKTVRPADNEQWDTTWASCDYATYFHSREWAEIWQTFTKGDMNPHPLWIEFSDNKKVLFPLSCQHRYKGLLTKYISSPGGTFGGWISGDAIEKAHAVMLNRWVRNELKDLVWRLNPYGDVNTEHLTGIREDVTHVLDLRQEKVWESLTRGNSPAARATRKASKSGVKIIPADSESLWKRYYDIYEKSLNRWGGAATSSYDWSMFSHMMQLQSPHIKLWLATVEKEVAAGALCLYSRCHAVYWHGAAHEDFFKLRPVNLLMAEAVKDACQKGLIWFDLNPSGKLEGVKRFKKSLGAHEKKCPVITLSSKKSKLLETASKLKQSLRPG